MPLEGNFLIRWWDWVTKVLLEGDFGYSCILRKSINLLLGDKFWISLGLCLSALLITYIIALPIGVLSLTAGQEWLTGSFRIFGYLGLAVPNFLVALIVLLIWNNVFGETLTGLQSREYQGADWSMAKAFDILAHAWLPVSVLAWSSTAFALVSVRALVGAEFNKPYVLAAQARGVSGRRLLVHYPVRHALGPALSTLGYDLARIFNELPVIALILSLTDAGALLLQALVRSSDQPLAAAILFLLTASIIALNLATDLILAVFDPRVRRGLMP